MGESQDPKHRQDPKRDLEDAGDHALHGLEDIVDVVGHGVGGAVKGIADGVEDASAQTEVRDQDET
ncbi:MAG: hypothetical protein RL347_14 [Actinomycetota bacterium]